MIAKEGQLVRGAAYALALWGAVGGIIPAQAQQISVPFGGKTPAGRSAAAPAAAPASATAQPAATDQPRLVPIELPVNPGDPIAVINGEIISRSRLANECIARKGEEILETLIARTLIEQALRSKKLEVTAMEVDQEIDNVAMRVAGLGREAWLRTLDKERGISPIQYARDIIYPALALRKLAGPRVQVTELDLKNSFEAQYGEKLRCRMIMVDKLQSAKEIWEELRKNPGGFEKTAMERSMDSSSRSLGGLLAEPISRHAYPQTVSDAAFGQLVDGDLKDKDPNHKPKDGEISGPIQVAEATWILLRREGLVGGQKVDPNNPEIKKQTYELIYEVKLKEAMGAFMVDLMQAAAIENKLTGKIKLASQPVDVDKEVQLMGNKTPAGQRNAATARPASSADANVSTGGQKTPTPAALSPDVAAQAETLIKPPASRK
jgi:parvulin-like peptidyl-prolyl isomerase